jgi:hypothetical protein
LHLTQGRQDSTGEQSGRMGDLNPLFLSVAFFTWNLIFVLPLFMPWPIQWH